MSQTAHYPAASKITSRDLESVWCQDLNVPHLIHGEADLLGAIFGEHHRPVGIRRRAPESSREVDHCHDRAAEVDQTADVGRSARKPGRVTNRNDFPNRGDVAPVYATRQRKQQQAQ